ncbi:MAG: hypothetical protein DDT28_00809 [Dehalococcoidia bacterium]|nr:hypothetical protein [Chloroflexota bacterium]
MQIHLAEQCVVVEHLLKVWDQPVSISSVAMESATYLIIDAASGHLLQG